jgi:hypothetical protein
MEDIDPYLQSRGRDLNDLIRQEIKTKKEQVKELEEEIRQLERQTS